MVAWANVTHFRLFGALAVGLGLVTLLTPVDPGWVERVYSGALYLSFQPYLTGASNLVPFALLDLGVGLILAWLIRAAFRDVRQSGAGTAAARAAARLVVTSAVVYLLFAASWGLNYRRVPLEQKIPFDRARVTQAAARQLAATAVERLNSGYAAAHAAPFRTELLEHAFVRAQQAVGPGVTTTTGRPKRSVAGLYFRYAAIDGMTVPVFLEIILNPDLLPVERPAVLAHEWAHLAGYSDESEATYIAWLAASRSADPVARYSAWLDAYGLAYTALPRAARAAVPPLDEGPREDLRAIAERYARSSAAVRRAARGVYDSYLKANRIEEGIENYAAALQLILGTAPSLTDPAAPAR